MNKTTHTQKNASDAEALSPNIRLILRAIAPLPIAVLLCATAVCGQAIAPTGYCIYTPERLVELTLPWIPMVWAVLLVIQAACTYLAQRMNSAAGQRTRTQGLWASICRVVNHIAPAFSKKRILIWALVLVACWAIYLVAFFPGSMNYDTYYQIYQCYPENHPIKEIPWDNSNSYITQYFCDHHPIFDTLLYGGCALASDALTGGWSAGIFTFAVIQTIATAFALSLAVGYLQRFARIPAGARLGAIVFMAVMPFYGINAQTVVKDCTFTVVFVLFFIALLEIIRTRGAVMKKGSFVAGFVVVALLCTLTKKTGVYIVAPSLLVLVFVYKAQWKRLLCCALGVALFAWALMPLVVFPLLSVAPSGTQEALSIPFQQTARVAKLHGIELSEEDKAALDGVLDWSTLQDRYIATSSDSVKGEYNWGCSDEAWSAYWAEYISLGLRYPADYTESAWVVTAGYMCPWTTVAIHTHTGTDDPEDTPKIANPEELSGLHTFIVDEYESLATTPGVGLLFRTALYAWWLPVILTFWMCWHRREWLPSLVPLWLSIISCWMAPFAHARYAYPIIIMGPIFACLLIGCFTAVREQRTQTEEQPPSRTLND